VHARARTGDERLSFHLAPEIVETLGGRTELFSHGVISVAPEAFERLFAGALDLRGTYFVITPVFGPPTRPMPG